MIDLTTMDLVGSNLPSLLPRCVNDDDDVVGCFFALVCMVVASNSFVGGVDNGDEGFYYG